jgi:hypothetical protein
MKKGKIVRIGIAVLLILFIIIQFIPFEFPETSFDNKNDLILFHPVDEEVEGIIKTSCYDCHSFETRYPWYSYVAPVKWLVIQDVREGREELNFSEWQKLEKREQIKMLEEIREEVEGGYMPLPIYTIMHRNASLSDDQKIRISEWATAMTDEIFGE